MSSHRPTGRHHASAGTTLQSLSVARSLGHGLFYAVMAVVVLVLVAIGCINIAERDRPTYWGTFTETNTTCDGFGRSRNCDSVGVWRSDDGTMAFTDIALDGTADPGENVRASYRPGGAMGDDSNYIVHEPFFIPGVEYWLPWVLALVCGASAWRQHRAWSSPTNARDGD
ncbi:hypothetical protein FV141_11555 [Dermacoccus abyssi]|uniref:DUF3592 domain-containing protein n=1 Tax=Dermacoccus abyssi TaxID=322596 RepID=A0ABX5ZAT2_9MICO|nr:hypothetical protein FV141_11555 [Dermacoccus abyssi]